MKTIKSIKFIALFMSIALLITGCVNQHPKGKDDEASSIPKIDNPRVVATSMATAHILDKLNANMVGVPDSKIDSLPKKYDKVEKVGMAMSPDIEKIKTISPDWVFSPVSLVSDLEPKYVNANFRFGFLNLNNIPGMYKSIEDLGRILNREQEANKLIDDYNTFMKNYNSNHKKDSKKKKVLILMGLPGSYVVATDKSYVGSLVELAGAENVYKSEKEQFINVSTEDMLKKNPELILRTAHALPEQVMQMFYDEFKTNQIWSKFDAVKNNKVYDLNYKNFGMSANFNYKNALKDLDKILNEGRR